MSDPRAIYRPLLDLIGKTEGTDRGRGYNETLAYGKFTDGDVDLTSMTLLEIDALQTKMLQHPDNTWNSSAIGRYQIVRTTLRNIRDVLNLPATAVYNEAMQDRLACFLLGGRGIDDYLAGEMSEYDLINALAKEWASLPNTQGKGHYKGQNSAVPTREVSSTLAKVRRNYGRSPERADGSLIQRPNLKDTILMKETTIHKAVVAFLTSLVALLAAFGLPIPEWAGEATIGWIATIIAALSGSGLIGLLTWWWPNQPK